MMPSRPTRRAFLAGTFMASGGFLSAAAAQETHYHAAPRDANIDAGTNPIRDALSSRVGDLAGLAPGTYLTAFDYGRSSRSGDKTVREFELVAAEKTVEVAPGIHFPAWTYNNSVPGPTLRCTEGDVVRVRFVNRSRTSHTIHFHGLHPASMDGVYEPVEPDKERWYEFTAEPAGLQFYHCHSLPVALHMNRGLFGALIIDPQNPRGRALEVVMVLHGWDLDFDGKNDLYAINGGANYYRDHPIVLPVGKKVRVYLINALEYEPIESFHIHANFFQVYRTGSQAEPNEYTDMVALAQAERCILEFSYLAPGTYMFHSHRNRAAELGCMGHFVVT